MYEPRLRYAAAPLMLLWLLAPGVAASVLPHYTVTLGERLQDIEVRACFQGMVPRRLIARDEHAPDLLRGARLYREEDVIALEARGPVLALPPAAAPACVRYRVDLDEIGRQGRSGGWRAREAIVVDPALWLWYPDGIREDQQWRLDFMLPPAYDVSGPWNRIDHSPDRVAYEVHERMRGRSARMAIGRFRVESIAVAGGRIRYALLPGDPAPDAAALRRWVAGGLRALVATYGRLPVPDLQLLLVPVGRGNEPVPWGEVQRGGGDAVHLYIDQRLSEQAFRDDWVLVHELSHLLHPVIVSPDRWLYEGIASYYQNVLRARVGLMSPQSAWNSLHAGFERGIGGTSRGRSLAETSETMMRDHSFMRVYWSGAAIALLADVELRRRSGGAQSLDTVLEAFHDCCLSADHSWTARELMRKLDRLAESKVFTELYRRHVDADDFPDLKPVYAELGLDPTGPSSVRLDPAAPGAAIGLAIMAASED